MDIEELLHKAILFEQQLKRRSYKPHHGNSSKSSYLKEAESSSSKDLKPFSKPKEEEHNLKEKEKPTNSKTRDIKCYKCQGSGHYARDCPNKRIMIIKESGELESEDEEPERNNMEEQIIMPIKGELLVTRRTLNLKTKIEGNEQRENLFHTRCVVQGKVCSMVIDGGSCTNVASETLVEKLGLTIQKRPTTYKLNWLNDEGELEVNDQVLVPFSIGQYEDEVLCDVLPMDAGHILLGRPWQSDRKVMHDGYTNRYSFDFKDQKIVLVPLTPQEVYQDQLSLKESKAQSSAKTKTSTSLLLEKSKGSSSTLLPVISKYCCLSLTMSKQVLPSNLKISLQETQEVISQRPLLSLPPNEQNFQLKQRPDEQFKWNLPGKIKLTPSFSVSNAFSFLVGQADLRTNLFQERGDDVIMTGPDIEVAHEVAHQVTQEEGHQDGSVKQHKPGWKGAKEQLVAEENEQGEPGAVDYTFLPPNKGTLKCVNPTTMVVIQTT